MTRFSVLIVLLASAKLSGLAGIVAMFCARRTLGGALLALDGALLVLTAMLGWRAIGAAFSTPIPGVKDWPKDLTITELGTQ